MDEMGGGLTNRANKIYRSTDGGNTWTNTYTGPTFPGPGRSASGFFATMYASPAYWRHMGWGQPAAYNGVVSLVYASRNTGTGDPGDVFYIRSTDMRRDFQCAVPIERQRRDHQGAVDAQPLGQRSWHPLLHLV